MRRFNNLFLILILKEGVRYEKITNAIIGRISY